MTTENGTERLKTARVYIEQLRQHRDFLLERMAEIEQETGRDGSGTYKDLEAKAIEWALPILEAEWDFLARVARNHQAAHDTLKKVEAQLARGTSYEDTFEWEGPTTGGEVVTPLEYPGDTATRRTR